MGRYIYNKECLDAIMKYCNVRALAIISGKSIQKKEYIDKKKFYSSLAIAKY